MVVLMGTMPMLVICLLVLIIQTHQLPVGETAPTSRESRDSETPVIETENGTAGNGTTGVASKPLPDSGTGDRTTSTRAPGFTWLIETDATTLSYVKRHLVGTILHSLFLTGLIICCVAGRGWDLRPRDSWSASGGKIRSQLTVILAVYLF